MLADLLQPVPLPAYIVYGAVLVLGLTLSLVIIVLRRQLLALATGERRVTVGRRLTDWLAYSTHPFMGSDGRPSFSKIISMSILAHYLVSANLPAVVACWIIAASFGVKVFLAVIDKSQLIANAATSLVGSVTKTITRPGQVTETEVKSVGIGPAPVIPAPAPIPDLAHIPAGEQGP